MTVTRAVLYPDPDVERTTQRLLAALVNIVFGVFWGASMVFALELMPLTKEKPGRTVSLFIGSWISAFACLLLYVYVYNDIPNLPWLALISLAVSTSFALPAVFTEDVWWRVLCGFSGLLAAFVIPPMLDPVNSPLTFDVSGADLSIPLSIWLALVLTSGTYFRDVWHRKRAGV